MFTGESSEALEGKGDHTGEQTLKASVSEVALKHDISGLP